MPPSPRAATPAGKAAESRPLPPATAVTVAPRYRPLPHAWPGLDRVGLLGPDDRHQRSGEALCLRQPCRLAASYMVAGTSSAPKNSVRVSLPITAKSMMTATLQKFVAGVYVVAAVPNVAGGYFTIYLNKSVTTSLGPIAWM